MAPQSKRVTNRDALSTAGPLLALVGAAIGAGVADAVTLEDADTRFAIVVIGMASALVATRIARPGSSTPLRIVTAALALPFVAALVWPRSALAMTWLSGGTLALGLDAVVHTARVGWRLSSNPGWRVAFVGLGTVPPLHLWASAFVVLFNTQLIVAPARLAHRAPSATANEETLLLRASDGMELAATYTPGRHGAGGVVLVHGVADGQSRLAPWAARLSQSGYHALRYDGRAHGLSDGAVVTYGQREGLDLLAAVDHLRARRGVNPSQVFVLGASMGGGTVIAHAQTLEARHVRGLIVLAPPAYYRPLAMSRTAWLGPMQGSVLDGSAALASACGQVPMTHWRPASGLDHTSIRTWVLHGRDDTTIPFDMARGTEIWPPDLLDGVGHNDLSAAVLEQRWDEVERFLEPPRYIVPDAVPANAAPRHPPFH